MSKTETRFMCDLCHRKETVEGNGLKLPLKWKSLIRGRGMNQWTTHLCELCVTIIKDNKP